jgi:hypothetical protein
MPNVSAATIRRADMTAEKLRSSALLGLAQEMGSELTGIHGQALRRSALSGLQAIPIFGYSFYSLPNSP